jgi:predicted protein tyrosine phosphatase
MQNAHEIIPRLWLGNAKASMDPDFLQRHHINVIFNCTKDFPFSMLPSIERKYRLPVDDNLEDEEIRNMELWAPETVMHIVQEYGRGSRILVHCAAGMQRSAAAVAMTLIVLKGWHADEAMKYVKSIRRIAFMPSANFRRAIEAFDQYYFNQLLPKILEDKKNN